MTVQRLCVSKSNIQAEESVSSSESKLHHVCICGSALGCRRSARPGPLSNQQGQKFPSRPATHPHLWKPAGAESGEPPGRSGEGEVE